MPPGVLIATSRVHLQGGHWLAMAKAAFLLNISHFPLQWTWLFGGAGNLLPSGY
jgi:hypothetical protein